MQYSYAELQMFIYEDIKEFMGEGLNIRQASSRVQVEYAKSIENNELESLAIYMTLCEEGLKNGFLRSDIKEQTLALLGKINLDDYKHQLSNEELITISYDMNRILDTLAQNATD